MHDMYGIAVWEALWHGSERPLIVRGRSQKTGIVTWSAISRIPSCCMGCHLSFLVKSGSARPGEMRSHQGQYGLGR